MLPSIAATPSASTADNDSAVPARIREMVEAILIASPVARRQGVVLDTLARDHVELVLPFSPDNVTVRDTVHGGVIATLIDIAGAAAAASGADPATVRGGATSSLSIQYLAPANGIALRAVAIVVRRGQRQVVTDVSVYGEDAEQATVVAKALMSSVLF
ncbi:PaaI family thioesterase [Cupriavidus respiraculi]|uniref:PaaI family thioesterase n=1 Tax=Cupriavidus respiraculi TaxID=195930 RepID=UPI001C983505|nr:PaaI family thioesterase [Cupriavidus respiraculi]MBY4946645.1 PaaI family thioesterase [Cupriavidus respiraculi]